MKRTFKVKQLKNGRAMLNLACGSRMHVDWNNLDFSPLAYLARHMILARILRRVSILSERRFQRLLQIDPDIIHWDLRKGIPFEDAKFDVVYHSHFLEHLDQKVAREFLRECCRVLKPSGVMRVVVPDLEIRCRNYMDTFQTLEKTESTVADAIAAHKEAIRRLVGQMVVKEPAGTVEQVPLVRMIERLLRGNTAKAGEIHRWMYDRFTLKELLRSVGFRDIRVESCSTGRIQGWETLRLDTSEDGSAYSRNSIYVEAVK